ncbi:Holliday junction DNA helicase subunit RuvA [Planifilum fimeticola]|uniref:Holliday junction branch migration complex subunit RuvA n=1 Tax=Planifilum fimeticola TaxID=201975 RepID=A0A2T0LCC9_9BACL|nr:Holliday junction branch migration protein RuvA [Planifilum fimeticola]PRX39409.1 Holliday junction DNA helicase subunit RuvA [Planifilum fimeticola]
MIEFVEGEVAWTGPNYLVIKEGGIGYRVVCPRPYLWDEGKRVRLYTHPVIREDGWTLYGFPDRVERDLFSMLLEVSGIGPKAGMAILARGTVGEVVSAIRGEDLHFLTRLPGIGKKTAQRIVLDLKDKLKDFDVPVVQEDVSPTGPQWIASGTAGEAIEALMALGYNEKEASQAVREARKLMGDAEPALDDWIRQALQVSAKRPGGGG